MRIREHLTYANVTATVAVFGVVASGGAYAASQIDTPDIANQAVTAKKLAEKTVKTSKLHTGAVTSNKLSDGAVGARDLSLKAPAALAGVVVYHSEVFGWFNRITDESPTLSQTQSGVYQLRIPGLETGFSYPELLSSVSLTGETTPGEINSTWTNDSAGDDLHPTIYTFDSEGNPADHGFVYLVYRADHKAF
jgi:hypothetical protein